MRKKYIYSLAGILLIASLATANQNKGPERLELDGGKKGIVYVPHRSHQERLNDCNVCHDIFPKKAGVIKALKAEGKLKNKFVMSKLCIKCHKLEKKAGRPYGPVKCSKCHHK